MTSWLSFVILAIAAVLIAEGRAIPAEPVSLMVDNNGNPILFLRDKRASIRPYPQTMMFTGYYRPVRRTNDGQATGVYAQGNAVSGGSYLIDRQPDYLQRGPEPIDESDVTSAEAEAAPNPLEHHVDEDEQSHPVEKVEHEQEDSQHPEDQEPSVVTTAPTVEDSSESSKRPSKKHKSKKTKRPPIVIESDSDESEEDEADEEDDDDDEEPAMPFVPFKKNHRQGNIPNLNNFFPMVFSYPQGISRGGSSGSTPGMITAIANSYSTSKGGVASSVATAYGGSPHGKKQRRAQPVEE